MLVYFFPSEWGNESTNSSILKADLYFCTITAKLKKSQIYLTFYLFITVQLQIYISQEASAFDDHLEYEYADGKHFGHHSYHHL